MWWSQDHCSVLGFDDESDVEEPPRELRVACLGLGDHVGLPLAGQAPESVGLRTGDVDGALGGVGLVVEIEDLVGETLKAAFGDADEPDREVHARQPRRCLHHMGDMFEVGVDLLPPSDAPDGLDQSDGLVRLDHLVTPPIRRR